jgi:hypothetical protein
MLRRLFSFIECSAFSLPQQHLNPPKSLLCHLLVYLYGTTLGRNKGSRKLLKTAYLNENNKITFDLDLAKGFNYFILKYDLATKKCIIKQRCIS